VELFGVSARPKAELHAVIFPTLAESCAAPQLRPLAPAEVEEGLRGELRSGCDELYRYGVVRIPGRSDAAVAANAAAVIRGVAETVPGYALALSRASLGRALRGEPLLRELLGW
jgi:hypothetical protein